MVVKYADVVREESAMLNIKYCVKINGNISKCFLYISLRKKVPIIKLVKSAVVVVLYGDIFRTESVMLII